MHVSELKGSPSLEVINTVLKRMARGDRLISLAIGEPMYNTPEEVSEVAFREMKSGNTHYVSAYGISDVRKAIAGKVSSRNGIGASEENTIFIPSKQAIYSVLTALETDRTEVLVPDPGYFYSDPSRLAGFDPLPYPMGDDGSLDVEAIRKLATDRTAAVFINTPSNPLGSVAGRKELSGLLDLAGEKGFRIISDEAYEDLVYEKEHVSIGSLEKEPDRVISIFTLSKSYSMTGWRAGYTIADANTIRNMATAIEQTYTCSPPFIQAASAYALRNGEKYVRKFRDEFRVKRDFVVKRLNEMDGVQCRPVEGTFYAFPLYDADISASDLAAGLLEKHDVALLPGTAFGDRGEKHVRISFSGTMETVETGLDRLEEFLKSHSP